MQRNSSNHVALFNAKMLLMYAKYIDDHDGIHFTCK